MQDINADLSMFECVNLDGDIPKVPCVYFLFSDDELVYVGNTINLRRRVGVHDYFLNSNMYLGDKKIGVDTFNKIYYRQESDKDMRKKLEKQYYEDFEPKLNFSGLISHYCYRHQADVMRYRLNMGLEKRWNI